VMEQRAKVPPTVELLSQMLFDEGSPTYPRDPERILKMEIAFGEQSDRELKALTKLNDKSVKPMKPAPPAEKPAAPAASGRRSGSFLSRLVKESGH
jgi:hypothetical protein